VVLPGMQWWLPVDTIPICPYVFSKILSSAVLLHSLNKSPHGTGELKSMQTDDSTLTPGWHYPGFPCDGVLSRGELVQNKGSSSDAAEVTRTWEVPHHKTYQQFEKIWKLILYMTSMAGATTFNTVGGDWVKHHLLLSTMQSLRFEDFSQSVCITWDKMLDKTVQ
jgi:hypothetical protein